MLSQQIIKFLPKFRTIQILFGFIWLLSFNLNAQNTKFTVALDAGHGGKDPGTVGLRTFKNHYESDVVLQVVTKLGKLLNKNTDIKTVYTRKTDTFVELHKRSKAANNADADLFISIHCNSAVTNAYGTTTYVLGMATSAKNLELSKRENNVIKLEDNREKNYKYDPNSNEFLISLTLMQETYFDRSIEFAGILQNKFKTVAKRKDRGVKQGNFVVLYDSARPSVLVEIGFLTNKEEEKYLNSATGQNKIAESIYQAIITYKSRLEKNQVKTIKKKPKPKQNTRKTDYSSVFYKIQIATSARKIEAKSANFKGLKGIERVKVGKFYKYFYGISNNITQAKKLRLKAIKKGYKDAFIAKFNFDKSTSDIYKLNYVNPFDKKGKPKSKSNIPKNTSHKIIFKVQLSSSRKKIDLQSYNFRGLKNVERVKIGSYYKYYYGSTFDYSLIKQSHALAKRKGYRDCFIVAIKNGKLISLREAIRQSQR